MTRKVELAPEIKEIGEPDVSTNVLHVSLGQNQFVDTNSISPLIQVQA
jgi:hypothetical protein